jgi:hypothetical protein
MPVGAFVNAEIEKRGTMISEKRTPDILEKKLTILSTGLHIAAAKRKLSYFG